MRTSSKMTNLVTTRHHDHPHWACLPHNYPSACTIYLVGGLLHCQARHTRFGGDLSFYVAILSVSGKNY